MFNGNWIYFFFIFFFGVSCHKSGLDETINHPTGERYLHLAHTRTEFNPYMISHIEDIDYSNYSLLMLGGDLTADSSSEEEILQYLDAICDLGNINTLWTLGNHDYYDIDNVKAYTNRPNYYSYFKNDICFIVLDTQDSLCHITGAQKEFFNQVMDTLRNASYLMVLHHKLIWMPDHPELEASISDISNGHLSHQAHHLYHNNFTKIFILDYLRYKQKAFKLIV